MQLVIKHQIEGELRLPINYHHIQQSILYHSLPVNGEYRDFIHNKGYTYYTRSFKMFTFGPVCGRYAVHGKEICFYEQVSWEVRSVDALFLKEIADYLSKNGITYLKQHFAQVDVKLYENTVEEEELYIRMQSPICIHTTESGKTHFYGPTESEFCTLLNANFKRKYEAYYGVAPESDIELIPEQVTEKDKYVTKYKGFYMSGWNGDYILRGKRKYLDFLYQVGLGGKNAQGFGMFTIPKRN